VHIDHGLARLEGHVSDLRAAGRPGGRDDGLGARERGLGVFAVGVGDPEAVASARFGHVGEARGKNAALAREFFVDEVGDAVRHQAQVALRDDETLPAEVLPAHHVPEAKAHVVAPVGQARDAARGERVGSLLPPRREVGARHFVERRARGIDAAKLPAALQVGLHDRGDLLRRLCLTTKRHDGHGQLRQPHARDFDAKLRQRRQGRADRQGREHLATQEPRALRQGRREAERGI